MPTIWSAKRILNFILPPTVLSAVRRLSILMGVQQLQQVRVEGGDLAEDLGEDPPHAGIRAAPSPASNSPSASTRPAASTTSLSASVEARRESCVTATIEQPRAFSSRIIRPIFSAAAWSIGQRRLVEEDQRRLVHERAQERDDLALAGGELRGPQRGGVGKALRARASARPSSRRRRGRATPRGPGEAGRGSRRCSCSPTGRRPGRRTRSPPAGRACGGPRGRRGPRPGTGPVPGRGGRAPRRPSAGCSSRSPTAP